MQTTTAGTPAASSASPSATADALHEPQSPTPTTTTSHVATRSARMSGGTGSVMDSFLRRTMPAAPCSCRSRAPTSSRNCSALRLTLASSPGTVRPCRSAGRAAAVAPPDRVAPAVGSMRASNICGSLPSPRRTGAAARCEWRASDQQSASDFRSTGGGALHRRYGLTLLGPTGLRDESAIESVARSCPATDGRGGATGVACRRRTTPLRRPRPRASTARKSHSRGVRPVITVKSDGAGPRRRYSEVGR